MNGLQDNEMALQSAGIDSAISLHLLQMYVKKVGERIPARGGRRG
jgi:hypothetical protein